MAETPDPGRQEPKPAEKIRIQGGDAMTGSGEGSWTRAGTDEGGAAPGDEDEPDSAEPDGARGASEPSP